MTDIEDIRRPYRFDDTERFFELCTLLIQDLKEATLINDEDFQIFFRQKQSLYKLNCSIASVLYVYRVLKKRDSNIENVNCEKYLRGISSRANSGVMIITVLTSPWPGYKEGTSLLPQKNIAFVKTENEQNLAKKYKNFSCKYDCFYYPQESAVACASKNGFDAVKQFHERANIYLLNGLIPDKIELLVLGGTWSSYPSDYQEEFISDLYYAANTFGLIKREKLSLEEEIKLNENATTRIIGLTLETRPDSITKKELFNFRRFGVTSVQLGVQHIDNNILRYINRGCYAEDTIQAIRLLKNNCFKVDIHLMPDLPSSNPDIDRKMFETILNDEDYQADQWKIYPCTVTNWTKIEKWYKLEKENYDTKLNPDELSSVDIRSYRPYAENNIGIIRLGTSNKNQNVIHNSPLIKLLIDVKCNVHPWIRLNRIVRDIPQLYVKHQNYKEDLRTILQREMNRRKLVCSCMRCREIKKDDCDLEEMVLVIRRYYGSGAEEIFLSFESNDYKILYGFLRLRLSNESVFEELNETALIRELKIVVPVNMEIVNNHSQHRGLGKRLLRKAEEIAFQNDYRKIAVIAGVGVRNYYRKQGYYDTKEGNFQIKNLIYVDNVERGIELLSKKKIKLVKERKNNIHFFLLFLFMVYIFVRFLGK